MAVAAHRGRLIAGLVTAVALLLGSVGAVAAWNSANHDDSRAAASRGAAGRAGMRARAARNSADGRLGKQRAPETDPYQMSPTV